MSTSQELLKLYEAAEADAHRIQAEKDAAIKKVRTKYSDKLRKAVDKAAEIQTEYRNRAAVEELLSREDHVGAKRVAEGLGLPTNEFPED